MTRRTSAEISQEEANKKQLNQEQNVVENEVRNEDDTQPVVASQENNQQNDAQAHDIPVIPVQRGPLQIASGAAEIALQSAGAGLGAGITAAAAAGAFTLPMMSGIVVGTAVVNVGRRLLADMPLTASLQNAGETVAEQVRNVAASTSGAVVHGIFFALDKVRSVTSRKRTHAEANSGNEQQNNVAVTTPEEINSVNEPEGNNIIDEAFNQQLDNLQAKMQEDVKKAVAGCVLNINEPDNGPTSKRRRKEVPPSRQKLPRRAKTTK